jgi:hypothetical protein
MKIDLKLGNLCRLLSIQNSFQGFRAELRFSSTAIELIWVWMFYHIMFFSNHKKQP